MAEFNKSLLMKWPGKVYTYDAIDNVDINKVKTDHISQEFLRSQIPSGLSHFKLNLKVGAFIILFCNLYLTSKEDNET